jgi:hypothetical protein
MFQPGRPTNNPPTRRNDFQLTTIVRRVQLVQRIRDSLRFRFCGRLKLPTVGETDNRRSAQLQ